MVKFTKEKFIYEKVAFKLPDGVFILDGEKELENSFEFTDSDKKFSVAVTVESDGISKLYDTKEFKSIYTMLNSPVFVNINGFKGIVAKYSHKSEQYLEYRLILNSKKKKNVLVVTVKSDDVDAASKNEITSYFLNSLEYVN